MFYVNVYLVLLFADFMVCTYLNIHVFSLLLTLSDVLYCSISKYSSAT